MPCAFLLFLASDPHVCWVQKNFLLVGFLCHTALLSSVPFVVWGALTFVGTAGSHICTELDTVMSGGQSNLLNPADTCPDPAEIQENIGGPITSMNEATASLNSLLEGAVRPPAEP